MLVGIDVMMFKLETNHNHDKLILTSFVNFTLELKPAITKDIPKNTKPCKENKMDMKAYHP
jgi:hypothetical protein